MTKEKQQLAALITFLMVIGALVLLYLFFYHTLFLLGCIMAIVFCGVVYTIYCLILEFLR